MDRSENAGSDAILAGRYRLGELLGSGGMGRVWRAHDEVLHRTVAVKELTAGRFAVEADRLVLHRRTQTEARAAARINHPNVVTVHDVLEYDGRPWIVMQYVDGRSLEDTLKESGPLGVREAARTGLLVLAALRAAHRAGVLHRDVKPANVLLASDGQVLLTDFGIAAIEGDTSITRTGELIGSVDYLAPERARGGEPDAASDLWALGATLFTSVQGVSPFRRLSPLGTLQAVIVDETPFPDRAGALTPVIVALLEKDPAARPGADEAERLLREVADGGTADARTLLTARGRTSSTEVPAAPGPDGGAARPMNPPTLLQAPPAALSYPGEVTAVTHVTSAPAVAPAAPLPPSVNGGTVGAAFPAGATAGGGSGPDPYDTRPAGSGAGHDPAPRRPRRKGRLITAIATAVVVVGAGAAYALTQNGGADLASGDRAAPGKLTTPRFETPAAQEPGVPAGGGAPSAQPTDDVPGAARKPGGAGKAHVIVPGWTNIDAPEGFSVALPPGYTRDPGSQTIDYTPDGDGHLVRFAIGRASDFPSPLAHLQSMEGAVTSLPAYRRIAMAPEKAVTKDQLGATHAASWEFSWTQDASQGAPGPRRAIDETWDTADGSEYAIYMAVPAADWDTAQKQFSKILASFQPPAG